VSGSALKNAVISSSRTDVSVATLIGHVPPQRGADQ
jgi:hypothetical protein